MGIFDWLPRLLEMREVLCAANARSRRGVFSFRPRLSGFIRVFLAFTEALWRLRGGFGATGASLIECVGRESGGSCCPPRRPGFDEAWTAAAPAGRRAFMTPAVITFAFLLANSRANSAANALASSCSAASRAFSAFSAAFSSGVSISGSDELRKSRGFMKRLRTGIASVRRYDGEKEGWDADASSPDA